MTKLAAALLLFALCLPAAEVMGADEEGPPRLSPRTLHRRLVRDPIDPRLPDLARNGFSPSGAIDALLSQAEVGASVVGRVVVKLDSPFSDSLFGYQIFSDGAAAEQAYAATSVANRKDVRLVAATSAEVELDGEAGRATYRPIECEHFVRSEKTDGLTQCKYLVADANVIVFSAISEAGQTDAVSDARRDGAVELVRAAVAHGRTRGYWGN